MLFGGMAVTVPVVGSVMVVSSLAASFFAIIAGPTEDTVVAGGVGALGAALFGIDVREHRVIRYEQALTGDSFPVMAHRPFGGR